MPPIVRLGWQDASLIAIGCAIAIHHQLHKGSLVHSDGESVCCVRSRADGDHTGIHAIPARQSAASVTAVFTSYLSDRPAAESASCSGPLQQVRRTCGGDRRYPFIGTITVATCSARISCGIPRESKVIGTGHLFLPRDP